LLFDTGALFDADIGHIAEACALVMQAEEK
jgi:hypothetical protein